MKLKCTFSQSKNFTAGEIYEANTIVRCGMTFNEVNGNYGFPITLQPGDRIYHVSAFSGNNLMADFEELE